MQKYLTLIFTEKKSYSTYNVEVCTLENEIYEYNE